MPQLQPYHRINLPTLQRKSLHCNLAEDGETPTLVRRLVKYAIRGTEEDLNLCIIGRAGLQGETCM
jgi:hypothetical protein